MMSPISPPFLRTAFLVVALALASSPAQAVELYQWVDADGVVSIGPNPPPGASAVPYAPGRPPAVAPAKPAAPATPAATSPALPQRASSPYRAPEPPCAVFTNAARKAETELADAEREITRLEARIEELQASDIAYARTECVAKEYEGPAPDCRASTFDRDKEIVRSEKALEVAHEKLADAEIHLRETVIPERCQTPASSN